jgi:SAM-dependent methyltransferase
MAERPLPSFTEATGNVKLRPLEDGVREPAPTIQRFVARAAVAAGRPAGQVRVLDVGCGRGDAVAWLCDQGYDAHGVEIRSDYLERGRGFLQREGYGADRLAEIVGGSYPYADGTFDVVLSDQVLEHVADLAGFAAEVARVSARGAVGLHVFPARWRPVEVHMKTPLVHWLPKGRARRAALRAVLGAGLGAPYFPGLGLGDRVEVFARYSDGETFYRPLARIQKVFGEHGLDSDVAGPSRERVAARLPSIPVPLRPAAGLAYRTAFSVCLETVRR